MRVTRFKALRAGLRSEHDRSQWRLRKWRKTEQVNMEKAFSCCRDIHNIFRYVDTEVIAQVEVRGKNFIYKDTENWEEMRILKAWEWTKKDSAALAIYCAELAIDLWEKKYPDDQRPRKALEAAKACFANPTPKNIKAAKEAEKEAEEAGNWAEKDRDWAAIRGAWVAEAAARTVTTTDDAGAARAAAAAIIWATQFSKENEYAIEGWLRSRLNMLKRIKKRAPIKIKAPVFKAWKDEEQEIPPEQDAIIEFGRKYDPLNNFNGTKYTVPVSGLYAIYAQVTLVAGRYEEHKSYWAYLRKNDRDILSRSEITTLNYVSFPTITLYCVERLNRGDCVELLMRHDASYNVILSDQKYNCFIGAHLIRLK